MASHAVYLHSQTAEVSERLDITVCSCLILYHVVQECVLGHLQTVDSGNPW